MKYLILLTISIVFLSSCIGQKINDYEIELAQSFCEDRNGILEIREFFTGKTNIYCKDGTFTTEMNARKSCYQKK